MITIRQLHAFRAVLETGSVTAAAETLKLSQPAVSQQLAALEQELGLTLFYRIKGQLAPTPDALELSREVEQAWEGLERLVTAARGIRRSVRGTIRVAAGIDQSRTLVPAAIERFVSHRPGVRFRVITENPDRVREMVAARRADVGISRWAVGQDGCDVAILYKTRYVCALPEGHRLAKLARLEPKDLVGEPLVVVCRKASTRTGFEQVFRNADVTPTIQFETFNAGTACGFVSRGIAVLIFEELMLSHMVPPNVVLRPFTARMVRTGVVLTPKGVPMSPLVGEFIDALKQVVRPTGKIAGSQRPKARKGVRESGLPRTEQPPAG